jgi:hypothetical protein
MAIGLENELVKKGVLKKVNHNGWVLNYPDFTKPKIEKNK